MRAQYGLRGRGRRRRARVRRQGTPERLGVCQTRVRLFRRFASSRRRARVWPPPANPAARARGGGPAAIRAERYARGDVSTSECLALVVRDANAEMAVVIADTRRRDWLASLRLARGAPDPRCAERRLRDAARRDAGSLFRVGGLFGYRDLFESWTLVDDDDSLAKTVPGARVMVTKAEFSRSPSTGRRERRRTGGREEGTLFRLLRVLRRVQGAGGGGPAAGGGGAGDGHRGFRPSDAHGPGEGVR